MSATAALAAHAAAQPITQVLALGSPNWVLTACATGFATVLGRAAALESVPLVLSGHPPAGVTVVVPAVRLWAADAPTPSRPKATALVATCAELRLLAKADLPDCRPARTSSVGHRRPALARSSRTTS